jgi:hypothetical protein
VVEGKITRKAAVAVLVIVLCVVLVAVLLIASKPDAVLIDDTQPPPTSDVATDTPRPSQTNQSSQTTQTELYLEIVSYSSIHSDNDTYHKYFSSSQNRYVYRNDNPNFLQRYRNWTWEIGVSNYPIAADRGYLGVRYFNVTVHNNSSLPVNCIKLFGQLPSMGSYVNTWPANASDVLQPGESFLFPVGEKELPVNAYATGYIANPSSESK